MRRNRARRRGEGSGAAASRRAIKRNLIKRTIEQIYWQTIEELFVKSVQVSRAAFRFDLRGVFLPLRRAVGGCRARLPVIASDHLHFVRDGIIHLINACYCCSHCHLLLYCTCSERNRQVAADGLARSRGGGAGRMGPKKKSHRNLCYFKGVFRSRRMRL